jgi:hypothetical protein
VPADALPLVARFVRCGLHPADAATFACGKCGRGHCGPCQRRTDKRTTPLATCLQCGGALQPVVVESEAETGAWATLRVAYGALGLACSAALALPMLYAGVVVTTLPYFAVVIGACAWIYFLGVVRWRAKGRSGLPLPSHVLDDAWQAMAPLGGFVSAGLGFVPALWWLARGGSWVGAVGLAALGVVWLPVPALTAAASDRRWAPLWPQSVLAAARQDGVGYLALAVGAVGSAAAAAAVFAVLLATLGRLPVAGIWLAATGAMPAAWALALAIGRWGKRHASEIGFDE